MGYSETLTPDNVYLCSLGDVFRTTVLLHLFKEDYVTWLTDAAAIPLLTGNPYIDRILPFNLLTSLQLQTEIYDVVINLEKHPGICSLADRVKARQRYGFRFNKKTGETRAYENGYEALAIATREGAKKLNGKTWEQVLFSMLGATWKGESAILGYKPDAEAVFDIGFNTHVGPKFPLKAWPAAHWDHLEAMLKGRHTYSWQQHLNNLKGYIQWIHSCRLLVTNDSLGLHLGIAQGKKVVALMGPTSIKELTPTERLKVLTPEVDRECIPCYKPECPYDDTCMAHISPEDVYDAITQWGTESSPGI